MSPEPIILLIAIAGLAVIVTLVIGVASSRKEQIVLTEAYAELADRYGGTYEEGGWFGMPSVDFVHAGSWVVVHAVSTGGDSPTYYTQARFRWQQPDFRCEVYPKGIWSRVRKLIGMEDVEIGSPEFEETYVIAGTGRDELRRLLNPSVQRQIERLRFFLSNNDVYVSFGQGRLLVKKRSLIRSSRQLQEFVELAIGLYDAALETVIEGVEFVEQAKRPSPGEAICQICGEPVTSEAVLCRQCQTPHHLDCWEYYGACSTYGCRETRYLFPGRKRLASSSRRKSKP